jgi:hypothetical protein
MYRCGFVCCVCVCVGGGGFCVCMCVRARTCVSVKDVSSDGSI